MKIQKVKGEDWEGWYIDGILVEEGHSVESEEIIEAIINKLKNKPEFSEDSSMIKLMDPTYIEDEEVWEKNGYCCPKNIKDLIL